MRLFGLDITRATAGETTGSDRIEPPVVASSEASQPVGHNPFPNEGWGGTSRRSKGLPRVTPQRAEQHGTVFACANNIAGDLMKVPLKIYQRDQQGNEVRLRDHPLAYLLNVEAAPGVPGQIVRFAMVYAWALRGNGFAYAPRDGAGELTMIEPPRGGTASVLRSGRERFYEFTDGADTRRRVPQRSMAHLRYLALDGWTGRSPIQVASESMGLALAGQAAAARTAAGGTTKAVIKLAETYADDETRERNGRAVKEQISNPDATGIPVLGPDEDIKSLDISAADQELLASRKYDREQIASIYRMPPSKLQMLEYGVKANGEQQAIDYLTDCLMHWSVMAEAQYALAMLTEDERKAGIYLRHDFGALLQPTIKDRNEALSKSIGGPFETPNEGRKRVGLPPVKGGDKLNPAPNMTRKEETDDNDTEENENEETEE